MKYIVYGWGAMGLTLLVSIALGSEYSIKTVILAFCFTGIQVAVWQVYDEYKEKYK